MPWLSVLTRAIRFEESVCRVDFDERPPGSVRIAYRVRLDPDTGEVSLLDDALEIPVKGPT